MLWCVVLGLSVALEMAEVPPRLAVQIQRVLEAAVIFPVTLTVAGVLVCWVARFPDQFAVQHELRKRVLKRLRAEGVEIAFPTAVRLARSG